MVETLSFDWTVNHPHFGDAVVSAPDRAGATMAATRRWGAKWTEEAAFCTVIKIGRTQPKHCKRCGGKIAAGEYCGDCTRAIDFNRRQARYIGTRDRRARYSGT